MSSKKFVRSEAMPIKWCAGCGLNVMYYMCNDLFDELGFGKNTVVVSGIGCTGRGAGYFKADSVHGIHGRTLPLAAGMKTVNPKLNVIVYSGDGDLLGIGGNHFLHVARRNDDVSVICFTNEVFAMTGGQAAPTTRKGQITTTTPEGNTWPVINAQSILLGNENYFYARCSPVYLKHMKECLKACLQHKGFSFVEVISPCIINYGRRHGKTIAEVFSEIKKTYRVRKGTKPLGVYELGIVKK